MHAISPFYSPIGNTFYFLLALLLTASPIPSHSALD